MNWILTAIFFLFLYFQYSIIGSYLIFLGNFNIENSKHRYILGFLGTSFIFFVIGFFCQLLKTSWNLYFILQLLVLVIIDFFIIRKKTLKLDVINGTFFSKAVKRFLKDNWICVLFVALFTIFSISNELPIYQQNYDDFYYIGKMVNLIDTNQLLNENYYNGTLLIDSSVNIIRILNTYELSYSFFASIFHIDLTFFCRVTMTVHTYVLFSIVYKSLAELFIKENYFSQYAIVPFFLFLIPCGYLQEGIPIAALRIHSYDLWQFQTAAFYGGSVVRMLAIPTLTIFSYPLIEKIEFRKLIIMAIVSVAFISFSTIFIQVFLLFLIVAIVAKLSYNFVVYLKRKDSYKKWGWINGFLSLIIVFMLLLTKHLDHLSVINTSSFQESINGFLGFAEVWYKNDILLIVGPVFMILVLLFSKGVQKKCVALILVMLTLLFFKTYFVELYSLTAFNMFFVINRTISSVQYLVLFAVGVSIIQFYHFIFSSKKVWIPNIVSFASITIIITFFFSHINYFLNFSFLGSGISNAGWNFSRVLDFSTTMTLDIYDRIGAYFNTLTYGNYTLYAPEIFTYNQKTAYSVGLVTASNRIQIHDRDGLPKLNENENDLLNNFCLGKNHDVYDVVSLIKYKNIQYILVFDEENKNILVEQMGKLVIESDEYNNYYLIEL